MKKLHLYIIMFGILAHSSVLSAPQIENRANVQTLVPIGTIDLDRQGMHFKGFPLIDIDKYGNLFAGSNWFHTVYKISSSRKYLFNIGIKGQGPGDLEFPQDLRIWDDFVFVLDNRSISLFYLDGKFINKFRQFRYVESISVLGENILCLMPEASRLITAFSYLGEKRTEFGEKEYKIDYSIHRGSDRVNVDLSLYSGILLNDGTYVYYIQKSFGDIFKYNGKGQKILEKRNMSNIVKPLRELYFVKGTSPELRREEPKKDYLRYIVGAYYFENKLYLLVEGERTSRIHNEIIQINPDSLEYEKMINFGSPKDDYKGKVRPGSIAVAKSAGNLLFYISYYEPNSGEVGIAVYKESPDKGKF